MARKLTPWWKHSIWEVQTVDRNSGKWVAIYRTSTRKEAMADAKAWKRSTGQNTRIVMGPGHRSRRDL